MQHMDEEEWEDWEMEQDESIQCVICENALDTLPNLYQHCAMDHDFSLKSYLEKADYYRRIKLINYIRHSRKESDLEAVAFTKWLKSELKSVNYDLDEYLRPVLTDDALLCCMDSDSEDEIESECDIGKKSSQDAKLPLWCSKCIHEIQNEQRSVETKLEKDNDTYYFDSYADIGIHRDMIADSVRTESYRKAIEENGNLFKDKVVLDVGCGTGILSMFAARAGARKVFAIDCSEIIQRTRQIIIDNGFENVIVPLQGKVEDIDLPVQKVDIIISEWMGYALLFESMLDSVLVAKNKWLCKQNGLMFPDVASMHLQGITDKTRMMEFWDNVYGFDMKAMRAKVNINDPIVQVQPASCVLTNRVCVQNIDILNVKHEELNYTNNFQLEVTKEGLFHGFLSTFDIGFVKNCDHPVFFSTGVEATPTHWQQVFFYIKHPFHVDIGTNITGEWQLQRNDVNPRNIDVSINWKVDDGEHQFQVYTIR